MNSGGNFLDYAGSKCGLDVGFGKMILLYADKTAVAEADLTAAAINAAVEDGTIVGIIKGWHTITGAPVAETNVERPGSAEMKLIRSEILADTLMFENTLANNEVIGDLVKAGSLYGILVDDRGNAFGDKSSVVGYVKPMLMNFSGKATTSFQKDQTSDKSVSVTVRYLVKEVQAVIAGIEVEDVLSKTLLSLQLSSVKEITTTAATFVLSVKDKSTNAVFAGAILAGDVSIAGATVVTATYVAATGLLTIVITGTGFSITSQNLNIKMSGDSFYAKETTIRLGE